MLYGAALAFAVLSAVYTIRWLIAFDGSRSPELIALGVALEATKIGLAARAVTWWLGGKRGPAFWAFATVGVLSLVSISASFAWMVQKRVDVFARNAQEQETAALASTRYKHLESELHRLETAIIAQRALQELNQSIRALGVAREIGRNVAALEAEHADVFHRMTTYQAPAQVLSKQAIWDEVASSFRLSPKQFYSVSHMVVAVLVEVLAWLLMVFAAYDPKPITVAVARSRMDVTSAPEAESDANASNPITVARAKIQSGEIRPTLRAVQVTERVGPKRAAEILKQLEAEGAITKTATGRYALSA